MEKLRLKNPLILNNVRIEHGFGYYVYRREPLLNNYSVCR